jgi:hypothetical protein
MQTAANSVRKGLALNSLVLSLLFATRCVCVPAKHIIDTFRVLGVSLRRLVVLRCVHAENSLLDEG